jgi:hypothetical protein
VFPADPETAAREGGPCFLTIPDSPGDRRQ